MLLHFCPKMEFVYIPRIWKRNVEHEAFQKIALFLRLASKLAQKPPRKDLNDDRIRKDVLMQLANTSSKKVPEAEQMLDIVKEAAFTYDLSKVRRMKSRSNGKSIDEEIFTTNQLDKWLQMKTELTSLIIQHQATVRQLLKLKKYFSKRYNDRETFRMAIQALPEELVTGKQKKLILYRQTADNHTDLLIRILTVSCTLRAQIEYTLKEKIEEGLEHLRKVPGYTCPRINVDMFCAKLYESTSQKYGFIDPRGNENLLGLLPQVCKSKVQPSNFVKIPKGTKELMKTDSEEFRKNVYVTSSGGVLDTDSRGKSVTTSTIKLKLVSKATGRGFGWIRSCPFSKKQWIFYNLEPVKDAV